MYRVGEGVEKGALCGREGGGDVVAGMDAWRGGLRIEGRRKRGGKNKSKN